MKALLLGGLLVLPVMAEADILTRPVTTVVAPYSCQAVACVLWRHSVQGFEVSDCYENRDGDMVLVRSHLPDFAAGLDHIPGRGRQVSDGQGGYFIEDLDEPVPGNAYVLRPGSAKVDHRLRVGEQETSLSARAEHARVRIALQPGDS